jgi:hypothetical protein
MHVSVALFPADTVTPALSDTVTFTSVSPSALAAQVIGTERTRALLVKETRRA